MSFLMFFSHVVTCGYTYSMFLSSVVTYLHPLSCGHMCLPHHVFPSPVVTVATLFPCLLFFCGHKWATLLTCVPLCCGHMWATSPLLCCDYMYLLLPCGQVSTPSPCVPLSCSHMSTPLTPLFLYPEVTCTYPFPMFSSLL